MHLLKVQYPPEMIMNYLMFKVPEDTNPSSWEVRPNTLFLVLLQWEASQFIWAGRVSQHTQGATMGNAAWASPAEACDPESQLWARLGLYKLGVGSSVLLTCPSWKARVLLCLFRESAAAVDMTTCLPVTNIFSLGPATLPNQQLCCCLWSSGTIFGVLDLTLVWTTTTDSACLWPCCFDFQPS